MELKEFSNLIQTNLTSSNIFLTLKDYHHTIEQLKYKQQISDEKIRQLEQLLQVQIDEKTQQISLNKQIQRLDSKLK